MNLRGHRFVMLASTALWLLVLLALFGIRAEVSHTYAHRINSVRDYLPWLTRNVSIPILGGDAAHGTGLPLFALVWLILWISPIAALVWASTEPAEASLARWTLSASLYIPVFVLVCLVVAFGLWLPFSLLGRS